MTTTTMRTDRLGVMVVLAGVLGMAAGAAGALVSATATRLPTGVFPARQHEAAFGLLRRAFPALEPVEDALSAALMNAGPIIHPPLILMNAGPLEHFERWDIHNEGTQASIRRVTDALRKLLLRRAQ